MFDSSLQAGSQTDAEATLHMVQTHLDLSAFHKWAGSRNLMSQGVFDDTYALHCLLTESFGPRAPRPFRLIVPRHKALSYGVLYGYSRVDADVLANTARTYADPWQYDMLDLADLRCKPMPRQWAPGNRLGFEVLVCPTVRNAKGAKKPGAERDVYLKKIERWGDDGPARSRSEVYADWLRDQFHRHGGAVIEEVELKAFQRVRIIRRLHARPIEGPSAVMKGILTITDNKAFNHLLARGIGRHRAYGYGMLLLRPANVALKL